MRGWNLDYYACWQKAGVVRPLTFNEKESNEHFAKYRISPKYLGTDFLLKDAYEYELALENHQECLMVTHTKYNTGDQVWYIKIGDKTLVTRIITHDGITWLFGDKKLKLRE
jgi:hypothetical protein